MSPFFKRFFSTATRSRVGFIGLGNMGSHMAANLFLRSPNLDLFVYDINKALTANFVTSLSTKNLINGASLFAVDSINEIAQKTQLVITMLPNNEIVSKVYQDEILPNIGKNSLLLDSSTVSPEIVTTLEEKAKARGCAFIDAPVSGGIGGAEKGTLTFMIGGPVKSFERVKFVLQTMGTHLIHCGDKPGSGQVAKICNNLLLGISMAGLCEVMKIAEKSGIDLELMTKIINTSSGRCWSSDTYNPVPGIMPNVPASNDYQGGFGVTLMKKDMTYGLQEARNLNLELPIAEAVLKIYSKLASSNAFKDKDFSSYYKAIGIEQ